MTGPAKRWECPINHFNYFQNGNRSQLNQPGGFTQNIMIQIENVNKENLFNEMMQKYPKATSIFCKWIDSYKESVGWTKFIPQAKFHDLPGEMQIGIWFAFVLDRGACEWLTDISEFDLGKDIEEYFNMMESECEITE